MVKLSLALFLFLGFGTFSSARAKESEVILPREYFNTVLNEIESATASLTVVQYIFNLNLADRNSPTTKIAHALVEAKNKGVKIEVILDQNVDFDDPPSKGAWILDKKNWEAYEYLHTNGIPVFFDSPSIYTHSKLVIRDGHTVLLGSTNWSNKSLNDNLESNVLIHNADVAQSFLQWVSTIERQTLSKEAQPTVLVPHPFIENPAYLTSMIKGDDKRGYDLYLYLLTIAKENSSLNFNFNYEETAHALNLQGIERVAFRRIIARVLNRLEKKYQLVHIEKKFGGDSRIHLNENVHAAIFSTIGGNVEIPLDYWNFGWSRKLSLAGKVFYLLSLHYSALSPSKPEWSMSGEQLAWSLRVSKDFIHKGVQELKKANLLYVQYDALDYRVKEPRRPNVYALKPLYDPAVLQKGLSDLEVEHGKEKFKRATKYAKLVFAQNDLNAIREFIRLENEYGRDKLEQAYEIIKLKNIDNPKRSVGYFFNTVKGLK